MLISLIERVREPVLKCLLGGVHRRGSQPFTHTAMKELFDYIESLTVSQGAHIGEPFTLLAWQKRFIRNAFKPECLTAALSVARGNGKTAICAAIGAASVDGPLAVPNAETLIVASSFQQAKIAFSHVRSFLQPSIDADPGAWQINDSTNHAAITHKPTKASVRAIASDARRAHGRAPRLILADEPAQWVESSSRQLLAALTTSLGKIPGSRMIALGTKPSDSSHWFSKWLADGADYSQCHAAGESDNPYRKSTWVKANPSLKHFPHLETVIRSESKIAKIDDSAMQAFKALRLNLGVSDTGRAVVLDASTWRSLETDNLPSAQGKSIWGVDLGSGAAMSAVASFEPQSGRLEVVAAFPGLPSLQERGKSDAVGDLYLKMQERGELITTSGRTVDVAELIEIAVAEFGIPERVACDRWRQAELEDALDMAGLRNVPIVLRGMGFKDGGDDMRRFRRAAIEGKIRTPVSLLMRSAIAGAVTVSDPAGNAKLAKARDTHERRDGHRDDALAASILAVAEGIRTPPVKRERKRYHGLIPV